jgi:hypothetical protein
MSPDLLDPAASVASESWAHRYSHAQARAGALADLHGLSGILQPALGTVSSSPWIPPECFEVALRMLPGPLSPDSDIIFVVPHTRAIMDVAVPRLDTKEVEGDAAQNVATFIRKVSGLSAAALGNVFPVARETFQRWVSGTATPSDDNLRRLNALAAFLAAAAETTSDVRSLLLSQALPESDETVYDWLTQGRLTDAWAVLSGLPSRRPYSSFTDAEGNRAVRVSGATRLGRDEPPDEEYDDFS